jgi:hypothetical protein
VKGDQSTEHIVYHTDDELLMMVFFTQLRLQHSRSSEPTSGSLEVVAIYAIFHTRTRLNPQRNPANPRATSTSTLPGARTAQGSDSRMPLVAVCSHHIRSLSSFQYSAANYHIAVYAVSVLDNARFIFRGRD